MVIDAAKGIEARTRKLFEICRLRDIPIITFINKMDREARDPIELLDEVANTLALDTAPVTWPVGRAAEFVGTYDLRDRRMRLTTELSQSDPRMIAVADEVDLVRSALPTFEVRAVRARAPHAGVLRQRDPRHRRGRPAGRAGRFRAAPTRAAGRHARGRGDRGRR